MNGLYSMINLGSNALTAHQNRMALIQQNVANASTPGYRRQRTELSTLGGAFGVAGLPGVQSSLPRSIDAPLTDRQLTMQLGGFGYHSARSQVGAVVEATFDPVNGVDVTGKASEFFVAMRALSSNPASMPERRDVIARAEAMTDAFARTARTLTQAQADVRSQATDTIDDTNRTLERIATLDRQIQVASGSRQPVGELVDERDRLVADIADDLQLRVAHTDDGTVHLSTQSGHALIEGGQARQIAMRQRTDGDVELTLDTGVGQPIRLDEPGGTIGGLLSSHNQMIGDRLRELDQLAFDFATEFNAAHQGGVGLDGTGGRDFFDIGATAQGAALSIGVNAAIAEDASLLATATDPADLPGGSDLLGTLIAFEDSALAGGLSLHDGLIGITQAVGTDVREALDATAASSSALAQLEQVQGATSGVSLEEELLKLNEAQRAYEASLKVIEASESMMDSLMSIGR